VLTDTILKGNHLRIISNLNQTLLKWFLGGPLPKLCPAFQNTDQDGCHSRT
jgi:hypothetical protein